MSTQNEYLLLFRGREWWNEVSPEELQKTMNAVKDWFGRLSEAGALKAAQPLARSGAIVSGKAGIVADGPFAESKEVIGGYALIQVNNLDEAVAIAKSCPTLKFGEIEVRPVAEECPTLARARQLEEQLAAAV